MIFRAQLTEGFEGLRDLSPLVIQPIRPKLAIESLQSGIILGCDLTYAHDGDSFRIGKMANDLAHAPLIGTGLEVELRASGAGSGHGQQFAAAAKALEDIG